MRFLKFILHLLVVAALTLLTQVGGIIYLLFLLLNRTIRRNYPKNRIGRLLPVLTFLVLYLASVYLLVPPLAKAFGRVPLPLTASTEAPVKPGNLVFSLLCRNYTTPELRDVIYRSARRVRQQHPDYTLLYYDANFPFLTGFPLLPHRSHDDGEKVDLGFVYRRSGEKTIANRPPTLFGYGYFEGPVGKERNQTARCLAQGHWQYDFTRYLRFYDRALDFDPRATADVIRALLKERSVRKIFIEPHLKQRLGLSGEGRIRFHGCRAVRHDDHIHVEL